MRYLFISFEERKYVKYYDSRRCLDNIHDDLNPQQYLAWAQKWIGNDATIVGGCCGIGPEHIAALAETLE
ncbi:homocysteine S-methyltransferase family protein [Aggregatibacter actinomycetemcomitans]|nr:homocysteine S-methyltransferase family protein [Aggregatibacter actinomycetemcomitans]MBN6081909.1 homocysteine S-methyltransferase family protein [Aggregatibacter actinomycetemcomitans]MBN6084200.1 homocysteine S-methyltransferase family protein [Aggregatibacter actinomycetemcomitans]